MSEADARNKADRELKDEYRNHMMPKYGSLIQYMLCCSSLKLFVLSYYAPLYSDFQVLMSVTTLASKRCSVRLYFQLFLGGSRLIYVMCVWLRIVVSYIYCVVLLVCVSSSCVPYVASFSGLSTFDCQYSLTFIYYLQPRCGQLQLQVAKVAADLA